jgi:hypothetical protein
MQNLSGRIVAGLASSILGVLFSWQPASAFTFDQQEVSQEKFVAIAVPLAQGKSYNLLILEQISAEKKCWQEDTAQPGVVDPLLLSFDFTGICSRSTDSNGYSVRVAGQDLGLDYKLSIKKRGEALVLVGYSYKDARAPELEIGRTAQVESGFLKIELAPGWRFAKRVYNGKTLGHIYLTRDAFPETSNIASQKLEKENVEASEETSERAVVKDDRPTAKTETAKTVIEPEAQQSKQKSSAFTQPIPIPVPTPGLAVPKTAGIPLSPPNILGTTASASSSSTVTSPATPFATPIQIPVPQPRQIESGDPRQYQAPTPFEQAPISSEQSNGLPRLTPGVLPVPDGTIPLGNAQNRTNVYQGQSALASAVPADGNPPAPPIQVAWASHRYRVIVNPADSAQHSALKSLVPDAFRASYQGQSVLQVGAYQSQEEADTMVQFLSQNGFNGVVEQR